MGDQLVSGLLKKSNLRVLCVSAAESAQKARDLAKLFPTSAAMLAQGLAAGAILGALQKDGTRLNFQVECEGPLHGLFVDADAQGQVRGYVKNRNLAFVGDPAAHSRAVFGGAGFISVLRDLGNGEHYRSSVALQHFELGLDMEEYLHTSDQVDSRFVVEVSAVGEEGLGRVWALLLQALPDGDRPRLVQLGTALREQGGFRRAVDEHGGEGPLAVLKALFPDEDLEVMSRFPVAFSCSCSQERVLNALRTLGVPELQDLLAKEGKASVTCEFCATQYVIGAEDIRELIAQAGR
ncbi:MAG: Hsp33 family molecular chaperone HslO [Myxococcota bacterium]|nr:Hsp33 family molecular chaperone HslO [Myxococcota bacterium]